MQEAITLGKKKSLTAKQNFMFLIDETTKNVKNLKILFD
jgi:hypothetical protein